MDISRIRAAASAEISAPTLDLLRQFRQVLRPEIQDGEPVIAAIQQDETEVVVYFRVRDERFFLALYLELEPVLRVRWAEIEGGSRVSLLIHHPAQGELEIPDGLAPLQRHNFGVRFEPPQNEVDELEKKIKVLLQALAPHRNFLDEIAARTRLRLDVAYYGYVSQMWGIHLEAETLRQLAQWNIKLDVDLYAGGTAISDWGYGEPAK